MTPRKLTRQGFKAIDFEKQLKTLYFFNGEGADGAVYYYYMLMNHGNFMRFSERMQKNQPLGDITDYGEVIAHGKGKDASPEIKAELQKKYQLEEDFELNIQKSINANLAEFTKQGKIPGRDGKWMTEKLLDQFIDEANKTN